MERSYEVAFIFNPTLDDSGVEQMMAKIEKMVENESGTIDKWERWPKRRLAFEIKKHTEGHYAFLRFQVDPQAIERLVGLLRLDETVLRHLVVNMDEWLGNLTTGFSHSRRN
jgi:small subunit ribosomal protein S6